MKQDNKQTKSGTLMKYLNINPVLIIFFITCIVITGVVSAADEKTVTDMRGKQVSIPADPQRVVILDKGLIAQSMKALGVEDKIVGSGGIIVSSVKSPTDLDTVYLIPDLLKYGDAGYPQSGEVNYEKVAFANPDLVIMLQSEYTKNQFSAQTEEAIKKIENLGLPLVVINGPGYYDPVSSNATKTAITLLGDIFNKKDRASEVVNYLSAQENMISDRTDSVPEDKRPKTLYIGLKNESTGVVWGGEYGDAKFSNSIAHIKNVYPKNESVRMSSEQLINLNPDVIILATNTVDANPDTLFSKPYETMREINAIKNKQVGALGKLTWWGDFRLDTPTILLISAKTVYPDQFADVNVYNWLMNHYKELYGLTGKEAEELAKIQKLDWMKEKNF
jgi:iron complex transport system substrate-binding protein